MTEAYIKITGIDKMLEDLDSLILTREDKVKAVNAGAEAYIKHLVPLIPTDKDRKKGKHLNQDVTFKPGQYADGSTDVGFTKKGYYYPFVNNDRFSTNGYQYTTKKGRKITKTYANHSRTSMKDLNYGTKKIPGQHFMEHAEEEAQEDIRNAMRDALKGGD